MLHDREQYSLLRGAELRGPEAPPLEQGRHPLCLSDEEGLAQLVGPLVQPPLEGLESHALLPLRPERQRQAPLPLLERGGRHPPRRVAHYARLERPLDVVHPEEPPLKEEPLLAAAALPHVPEGAEHTEEVFVRLPELAELQGVLVDHPTEAEQWHRVARPGVVDSPVAARHP